MITLTNTATASIGGTTVESDAAAAITYFELAYPDSLRIFTSYGTFVASPPVFTPGAVLPKVITTVNLNNGIWSSSNGLSGTLTGGQLTSMQTVALSIRNGLESLIASGVVPGVTTAWTAASF
jgi:hypothetical protein